MDLGCTLNTTERGESKATHDRPFPTFNPITAIGSTEGADRKFRFGDVFGELSITRPVLHQLR
jgi:hypothetical protein